MVNILRLVVFISLLLLNPVYAAFTPEKVWTKSSGGTETFPSAMSACSYYFPGTTLLRFNSAGTSASCDIKLNSSLGNVKQVSGSCPDNSTKSGSECTCNVGTTEKDGQCRPKNPCPEGQHEEGGACVPDECKPEEIRVNGLCVPEPPCPPGESRINGVCKPNGCKAGKEFGEIEVADGETYYSCEGGCTVKTVADTCVSWDGNRSCTGTGRYTGSTCKPGDGGGGPGSGGGGGTGGSGPGGEGGGGTGGGGEGTGGTGTGGGEGTGGTGTGGGGGTGGTGTGGGEGTGGTGTGGGEGTGGTGTGDGGGTGGTGGGSSGGSGSGSVSGGLLNPVKPDNESKCSPGFYKQGSFCFPDKKDPDEEGECPEAFNKQGKLCIQNSKDPDAAGKCEDGFVKINGLCYPTTPSDKDGDGDGDGDGDSGFGGSCASGFTCEGDAIQCAIAKEQHNRNCKFYDTKNLDPLYKKAVDGTDPEGAEKMRANAEKLSVSKLDESGLGWSRGCPADPSFEIAGGSFEIPFSKVCGILSVLANVAVGLTLLSSLLWVVGTGIKS